MDKDKIKKSTKRIKEEVEAIEEEVKDKNVKTYGDPIVECY
jgi:archaellum component FlaC